MNPSHRALLAAMGTVLFCCESDAVRPAPDRAQTILSQFKEAAATPPDLPLSAGLPCAPDEGFPGVTNDRYYFLSEVGGCPNLPCFLNEVAGTAHSNATLVIDQQCTLFHTLRIPSRFTLAGVGMAGEGSLVFEGISANSSAIIVEDAIAQGGNSETTIRDLAIFGDFAGDPAQTVAGLNVSGGNIVRISNVRVSGFTLGIYGEQAFSVLISDSNVSANDINVALATDTNHWRIRDSVMSQANEWSVYILGPANDQVISGTRFEGSQQGAVRLGSYGAVLMNNRFESNNDGAGEGSIGVRVDSGAQRTRIISNIFSTDTVVDQGEDTVCLANIFEGVLGCE